ncbi:MAG: shikimate kinase [Bacteroidia bacterium]|nr:shikimate kinase [Bacteroidia bacterium]
MRIYLIGYMGAGKSVLGRELALKMGFDFIDLDQMVELQKNQTISSIFETHGEATFREFEKEALLQTANLENTIISTGGGAPCFSDNINWMNENGLTVFLKVSLGKLFHRLTLSKKDRPLIKDKPDLDLMEFMIENLIQREEYYSKAKLICEDDNLASEKLFDIIQKEVDYSK